jgi:hypothetical protein
VHVHSHYSHDSRDSLEDLREFSIARGLRFLALTDHAEDFDQSKFRRFQEECRRLSDGSVSLIAGLEFRFSGYPGLHLLALGLSRWIQPRTFEEFFALTASDAAVTMAAHPKLYGWAVPDSVARSVDAIEIWNASYNTRYLPDPRAITMLHEIRITRPGVVAVAGLDQHDARNDRGVRVVLTAERWNDPLAELRAGRFENHGKYVRLDSRASISWFRWLALVGARWTLDTADTVHESLVRAGRSLRS